MNIELLDRLPCALSYHLNSDISTNLSMKRPENMDHYVRQLKSRSAVPASIAANRHTEPSRIHLSNCSGFVERIHSNIEDRTSPIGLTHRSKKRPVGRGAKIAHKEEIFPSISAHSRRACSRFACVASARRPARHPVLPQISHPPVSHPVVRAMTTRILGSTESMPE
jgi:hypothetical protein